MQQDVIQKAIANQQYTNVQRGDVWHCELWIKIVGTRFNSLYRAEGRTQFEALKNAEQKAREAISC